MRGGARGRREEGRKKWVNIVISAISFTSFPKPPRTGKKRYFPYNQGSISSRFQCQVGHMAPQKPPPAGPARSPAGHRSAEGRLRQGCSSPPLSSPPLPPLSHLPWLSTRRCWQRCFPAPLTSSGSVGSSGTAAGRHSRGAEPPGDHPPPAPSAVSPRA